MSVLSLASFCQSRAVLLPTADFILLCISLFFSIPFYPYHQFSSKEIYCHPGTFGQDDLWDVYNPATFKHPMVPYDVLVDPQSMPTHPVFDASSTTSEYICDSEEGQAGGDAETLDGDSSSQGEDSGERDGIEERDEEKRVNRLMNKCLSVHNKYHPNVVIINTRIAKSYRIRFRCKKLASN